jgi:hypothetical protein
MIMILKKFKNIFSYHFFNAFERTRTRGFLILKNFKKLEIKGFFNTNILKEIKTIFF